MKTYQIYRSIELRATVEAEDEAEARFAAAALDEDEEGVEVVFSDYGTIP